MISVGDHRECLRSRLGLLDTLRRQLRVDSALPSFLRVHHENRYGEMATNTHDLKIPLRDPVANKVERQDAEQNCVAYGVFSAPPVGRREWKRVVS